MRRTVLAALLFLAALDVAMCGARVVSVIQSGHVIGWPGEGSSLYAIWRIRHGYPLYEWPTRPFFSLTLYNFLFYELYAGGLTVLRVPDAATPVVARLITMAFAAIGAVAQYGIASVHVRACGRHPPRLLFGSIAVITWFGWAVPGWWTLLVRPDMAALACSTLAVWVAVAVFAGKRSEWLAIAGVALFAGWAFKQSQVAFCAGLAAYVLAWRRSPRELFLLLAPVVLGIAATLVLGGPAYRYSILDVPRLNAYQPSLMLPVFRIVRITHLLQWIAISLVVVMGLRRRPRDEGPALVPVLLLTASSLVWAILMLPKEGSYVNHLLDLTVAAGLLTSLLLWSPERVANVPSRPMFTIALIALAAMLVRPISTLRGGSDLRVASEDELVRRHRLVERMAWLPPPVLVDDETLALPWFATRNRYPTVLLDHLFFDAAEKAGLTGDGIAGLVARRYFGSVLAPRGSPASDAAGRAAYVSSGTIDGPGGRTLDVLEREP